MTQHKPSTEGKTIQTHMITTHTNLHNTCKGNPTHVFKPQLLPNWIPKLNPSPPRTNTKFTRRNPTHVTTRQQPVARPDTQTQFKQTHPSSTRHNKNKIHNSPNQRNTGQTQRKSHDEHMYTIHPKHKKPDKEQTKGCVMKEQPIHLRKIEPTSISVQGKSKNNKATEQMQQQHRNTQTTHRQTMHNHTDDTYHDQTQQPLEHTSEHVETIHARTHWKHMSVELTRLQPKTC